MESNISVQQVRTIHEPRNQILGVKWNFQDSMLAACCSDGGIRIYSTLNWHMLKFLSLKTASSMPMTSICWKPQTETSEMRNVLLGTTSDGWIAHWIASSASVIHSFRLQGEQALASDYAPTGDFFAVGSRDFCIDIFDANTMEVTGRLEEATGDLPGHSNRIFSLKWTGPHTLASGGWDNTIIIWDVRTRYVIQTFYGPHLCGQCIDLKGNLLLTGSYERVQQLQIYNLMSSERVYCETLGTHAKPSMVYSAGYSKLKDRDWYCTAGTEVIIWDADTNQKVYREEVTGSGFCVDWAHQEDSVAVGTSEGNLKILKVSRR